MSGSIGSKQAIDSPCGARRYRSVPEGTGPRHRRRTVNMAARRCRNDRRLLAQLGSSSFTAGAVPSPGTMAETDFPETGLEFGVFDWIESSAAAPAEIFEHKLQIAEIADAAGFRGWHLAEHQVTIPTRDWSCSSSRCSSPIRRCGFRAATPARSSSPRATATTPSPSPRPVRRRACSSATARPGRATVASPGVTTRTSRRRG